MQGAASNPFVQQERIAMPALTPPLPNLLTTAATAALTPVAPPVATPGGIVSPLLHSVRCGCWLISYRPARVPLVAYDGTLRVECHSAGRTASGDLYQRPVLFIPARFPPGSP